MKRILILFILIFNFVFPNNSKELFDELEGNTNIYIFGQESKGPIEGCNVNINKISFFSDSSGRVNYSLEDVGLLEKDIVEVRIKKDGYKEYKGKIRVGDKERYIYLSKKRILTKSLDSSASEMIPKTSVVRVVKVWVQTPEDGILFIDGKRFKNLKVEQDNYFRVKEGIKTFTFDSKTKIYKKQVLLKPKEARIIFTEKDIVKRKAEKKEPQITQEKKEVYQKKAVVEKKESSSSKVEKKKITRIPKITNKYLIETIVKPLEDKSAFNISTDFISYKMIEDEDRGDFVRYENSQGERGELSRKEVNTLRYKLKTSELLDDYRYIKVYFNSSLKKSYVKKAQEVLKRISKEEESYVSIDSNWSNEGDCKYIALSSFERIQNNKILDEVYRISYKNTKRYKEFFDRLDEVIKKENEFKVSLSSKDIPLEVFNLEIGGYYSNDVSRNLDRNVSTNLGKKEIKSSYLSEGRYIDCGGYLLLKNVLKENNKYYFLRDSSSRIEIFLIRRYDGKDIVDSDFKRVR